MFGASMTFRLIKQRQKVEINLFIVLLKFEK